MTRIKICGITRREDALAAIEAGADAIGLVFADSPRRVSIDFACDIMEILPPFVSLVGVFVDEDNIVVRNIAERLTLDWVQLHGDESPEYCDSLCLKVIKRFNVRPSDTAESLRNVMDRYPVAGRLLDPGRGTGATFDWKLARGLAGPLIVSGGLTPENVADAIRVLRPFAVDVASGVESSPGVKDVSKIRAFVAAVRRADADDA